MPDRERDDRLRVLIADENTERLAQLASVVRAIGHDTVASEIEVSKVGGVTMRERPDVALVALGESDEHALEMISTIVAESECPVIAVLPTANVEFTHAAAARGVFAYVIESDAAALESALEIVLVRFAEYHGLQGAFGRRALLERAKGMLMERHGVGEDVAFELLRSHARKNNQKIVAVAEAVVEGQLLLRPA